MTDKERRLYVYDLMAVFTRKAIDAVPNMPEEWSGRQLRKFVADIADSWKMKMTKEELVQYRHDIKRRNLL